MRALLAVPALCLSACDLVDGIIASNRVPEDAEIAKQCGVSTSEYQKISERVKGGPLHGGAKIGICSVTKGADGELYLASMRMPGAA